MQPAGVKPQIAARIRAREAEALALGWTGEELWETKFWNITPEGNRPGLAAVLGPGQEIGRITELYIELYRDDIFKGRLVQRFYRKS
ncbi:hypothetical protein [Desulfolucanica intricata]|uniref:hypothetical protein n=1 Tax=Desulfolucanica intricata TaxID=1285191 RepID=UPI0008356EA6|nr:hypothetical protein [Desulfolucanica intricata]